MTAPVVRTAAARARAFEGGRRVRFCFSDGSIDRMGDTIDPNGWELTSYRRNPTVLWAHDSSQPPIGRASNLAVENGRLMGTVEFADSATYPFADQIFGLVRDGYINAVSVGFRPIEWKYANTPSRESGIDFTRQELLEVSVVPVPALPSALVEGRCAPGPVQRRAAFARAQRAARTPFLDTISERAAYARALRAAYGTGTDPRTAAAQAEFQLMRW